MEIFNIVLASIACLISILSLYISKRREDNNKLKDTIICEIIDLRGDYRKFMSDLYSSKLSSKQIIQWYKIFSMRLNSLEQFVKIKLQNEEVKKISTNTNQIRVILMESSDFESQYTKEKVNISPITKDTIESSYKDLNFSFFNVIFEITRL